MIRLNVRSIEGRGCTGFTLIELLVVLAITLIGTLGVGLAMRDHAQTRLEREALRLAALFEAARSHAQASGALVRMRLLPDGFQFEGLEATQSVSDAPQQWLDSDTGAMLENFDDQLRGVATGNLLLGPEPIIASQAVVLFSRQNGLLRLRLFTDGVRPFGVQPAS